MFHIAWKSFRYNITSFVVFFLSAVFSVAMIFGFMYLSELTKGIKVAGIDSNAGYVLGQTVVVVFVAAICIMVYSVKFYIRTRSKDYSMLLILGIKKRQFILFVALEYLFSWILSILIGLVLGNLIVGGFKWILGSVSGGVVAYSSVNVNAIYGKVFVWCIAMVIGVVIALIVYMNDRDLSLLLKADVAREKPKVTKIWGSLALGSLAVVIIGVAASFIADAEEGSMPIGVLVFSTIGFYGILLFGAGFLFEWFKTHHTERYYKKMLVFHNIFSKLTDNINVIAIQILIGMTAIYFIWTVSGGIWEVDPGKYPYDLVCWETVDQEKTVEEVCNKYVDDIVSYPSLENYHVNSQLIGISESTYKEILGKTFRLKGKEFVYLWGGNRGESDSFQKEKGNTEIALGEKERINNDFKSYFLKEKVKYNALFGEYLPNVVVFSDAEFQRLYDKNEGSKSLTIVNGSEEAIQKAEAELKQLRKGNKIVIHGKKTMMEAHRMEGIVRFTILAFGAVTILFFMLFTLCIKLYSDLPAMKNKYRFLHTMGIKGKEKIGMIKQEVTLLVMPPALIAAVMGTIHCIGFLKPYNQWRNLSFRFVDTYQNPSLLWILPQAAVYILIMFLFTVIMRNLMVRWIEKE